jgi:hypothetical protein
LLLVVRGVLIPKEPLGVGAVRVDCLQDLVVSLQALHLQSPLALVGLLVQAESLVLLAQTPFFQQLQQLVVAMAVKEA